MQPTKSRAFKMTRAIAIATALIVPLSMAMMDVPIQTSLVQTAQAGSTDQKSAMHNPVGNAPASFADLAENLLPTVVNISTTQEFTPKDEPPLPEMPQFPPGSPFEEFFEEFFKHRQGPQSPMQRPASLGSGFIIDAENGYIVTNNHVVPEGEHIEIKVILHNDKTLDASVVGRDEKTDLCVLKVETDEKLTSAKWGNSDQMRVGDWVIAIGNPFGLGGTVTAGIISARQRNINAGPYDDFIQTDASINRGNSGGPMFDMDGEVIGINTAIFSPSGGSVGIGFAIPSDLARTVVDQLIKYGQTRRGWIGVRIQVVTDEIAESLKMEKPMGALIASITPGGPSEKSGLKPGDVIVEFNGKPINEMRELPRIVAETEIGSTAKVGVWRDGKRMDMEIKVGELEAAEKSGLISAGQEGDEPPSVKIEEFGLKLSELKPELREKFGLRGNETGVLLLEVETGSIAYNKDLRPGDIISEVEHDKVTTPQQVQEKVKSAKQSGQKSLLIRVIRHGNPHFVVLKFEQ